MSGESLADAGLVASRLIWYAGCLGVVGASVFRVFVSSAAPLATSDLDRATATTGLLAGIVLIGGVAARLLAQTFAAFGPEEPITVELLFDVATRLPPWSTGWMVQAASASLSVMALVAARVAWRPGWVVAHVAAVAVAASVPLTGHALSQPEWPVLPAVLQSLHVLSAGAWIGGLFVLLTVGVARALRRPGLPPGTLAALVNAFSPIALVAVGVLGLTGAATTSLYLGTFTDLWMTGYGRTLLVKVTAFAGVAAAGLLNWRYVRPRLAHPHGGHTLRKSAVAEVSLAMLVLAVTAVLVGLPQPGE